MREFGNTYRRSNSSFWWIRYSVEGELRRESSKCTRISDARKFLKKRLLESQRVAEPLRLTMTDCLRGYLADASLRGLRSIAVIKRACAIVEKHLGEARANDITSADLKRLQWRLNDDGYAPATINRLVTTAYGALKLAERSGNLFGKLPQAPKQLKRPKPRQGFLEHDDYLAISAELPDWGKDVFEMFYRTGWRRGEVLWLTWEEVDLEQRVIRLDPDRDKNGETRLWPLRFFLEDLMARRARARVVGVPFVFHRDGQKIGLTGWRGPFVKACAAAGRSFYTHDCRRTVARAFERAGVPRSVAMKLIGHKTETMYKRYRIVNEEDLLDGVSTLEGYYRERATTASQRVIPFGDPQEKREKKG